MTTNLNLRRKLQIITDRPGIEAVSLMQLEGMIADLNTQCQHSVKCLPDKANGTRCFVYAFNLVESAKYKIIANCDALDHRNIFFAGKEFALYLVNSGRLIVSTQSSSSDIVVYFDESGYPTHAGKVLGSGPRIESKWGGGVFAEHELWEIPESYGNTHKFYKEISSLIAEAAFCEFVMSRPGFQEFIDQWDLHDLF